MNINEGYIIGTIAIVFFFGGYLLIGWHIRHSERSKFKNSPAGRFAKRLAAHPGIRNPSVRFIAACPDGTIIGSPYKLRANADGWDDDREHYFLGIDMDAAEHWRESQVTRKQVISSP